MNTGELFGTARDAISARAAFGEPIERDGYTVIPVACASGGGGIGGGRDERGAHGEGGGFGLGTRPLGVYVIGPDGVRWIPAVDVNRVISTVGTVTLAAVLAAVRISRRARPARRRRIG